MLAIYRCTCSLTLLQDGINVGKSKKMVICLQFNVTCKRVCAVLFYVQGGASVEEEEGEDELNAIALEAGLPTGGDGATLLLFCGLCRSMWVMQMAMQASH